MGTELQLPQNYSEKDIEELMKKAFPDYVFSWTGQKSKPLLGKHKGSEIIQAMLIKNTFTAFAIRIKIYPDNSKFILWESTWSGSLFYLILIVTGIIPILIVLMILKFTSFKTKEAEFDRLITNELKKETK